MGPGDKATGSGAADGGDQGGDTGAYIGADDDGNAKLGRQRAGCSQAHRHRDHGRAAVHDRRQYGACGNAPEDALGSLIKEPLEQAEALQVSPDGLHEADTEQNGGKTGGRKAQILAACQQVLQRRIAAGTRSADMTSPAQSIKDSVSSGSAACPICRLISSVVTVVPMLVPRMMPSVPE